MLPKKYEYITFAFFMSFFMTLLITFVIVSLNIGFSDAFIAQWLIAFSRAYIIAFPSVLLLLPVVRKIVGKVISQS